MFVSHPQFQDFPQHADPLWCVVWTSSCPAGKQQGDLILGEPNSRPALALCSKPGCWTTISKSQAGSRGTQCPQNQSLQQIITEPEDCPPGGHWDPALSQDQEIKLPREDRARRDSVPVPAGGCGWAGGLGAARGVQGPRSLRQAQKKGGSLDKCLSSPPSAQRETASPHGEGQGRDRPLGSRYVISRHLRLGWTPSVPQSPSDPLSVAEGCISRQKSLPPPKLLLPPPPAVPRPQEFQRPRGLKAWLEPPPYTPRLPVSTGVDLSLYSRPPFLRKIRAADVVSGPGGRLAATCRATCTSGQV